MSSVVTGARLESPWEASFVTSNSPASDSTSISWGSEPFGGVRGSRELWDGDVVPEASPPSDGERDGEDEGESQSSSVRWDILSALTTEPKSTAKELRRP